jgi:DNA (cytosine-5)-methyltransferase 1
MEYARLIRKSAKSGESEAATRQRLVSEGKIIPTFYKRYYWSAYTRLRWDEPALTITANANFLGSGRFTHPERDRGITMREAARLQSFDDAFTFHTSNRAERRTEKIGIGLDMIGEAVPPLMGQAIGRSIAARLDQAQRHGAPREDEGPQASRSAA